MNFIIKGNICYSKSPQELSFFENSYLVCEGGVSRGVFDSIPEQFKSFPVKDYSDKLIFPGLVDLHTHAPQFSFRAFGMDMELLDWLKTYTFPEEIKYEDLNYADKAYDLFVRGLSESATTRACIFATIHLPATVILMEKLEKSSIISYTGLVNMDRNCPDNLSQKSPHNAYASTKGWIESTAERFLNTKPILTPRFIPVCSDDLMKSLKKLQTEYNLPVQSHLSENAEEVKLVEKLSAGFKSYAGAYDKFNLFGSDNVPTIMAHCVWCSEEDKRLLRDNGVYVAHCPASNTNLSSGIAPVRDYLSRGIRVGLGSDIAGGTHLSIFKAMSDAVQVSKLYTRHVDSSLKPLTVNEAFYLGTAGGGSFFGKVGSFEDGFEFDAVVIDDSNIKAPYALSLEERLTRAIYLSDEIKIVDKYIRGTISS